MRCGPSHVVPTNYPQCDFGIESVVWTGTSSIGTTTGLTWLLCGGWTSAAGNIQGRAGNTGATDVNWTSGCAPPCSLQARLYCLEQ